MIDGMWIIQFQGVLGSDAGVVVFTKGKVMGGDNGFTYIGDYSIKDGTLKIHRFNPKIQSVLGVASDDYALDVTATVNGDIMKGQASLVGEVGSGIVIKLTKCAELP